MKQNLRLIQALAEYGCYLLIKDANSLWKCALPGADEETVVNNVVLDSVQSYPTIPPTIPQQPDHFPVQSGTSDYYSH